jgi:acetyl esterase/lipase
MSGDKGQYRDVALTFANAGIAVACVNYRLSSNYERAVQHPAHVKDIAAAYHWLRENAASYGYDTKQIFLMGHSAGAHIVSLLVLDGRYLKDVGENPKDAAGVIALAGIYDIPELINRWPRYQDDFIAGAFGKNKKKWAEASPLTYVRDTPVPWLIIHSPEDELIDLNQSQAFVDKLNAAEDKVTFVNHFYKNHFSTIMDLVKPDEPLRHRIIEFITGPVR